MLLSSYFSGNKSRTQRIRCSVPGGAKQGVKGREGGGDVATLQRGKIENNMKRSQKSWLRKRRRDAVSDRKNKCKERVRGGGGTRQQQQHDKEGRGWRVRERGREHNKRKNNSDSSSSPTPLNVN